jgi:AraC family transcriptional regulator of adaptative response/methylated-DNA-[protein]-cysteine methyltransferase
MSSALSTAYYSTLSERSNSRGMAGMEITYTTSQSPLGTLLVATSAKGVCMITTGKSVAAVEERLFDEFADATITRSDSRLASLRKIVENRIAGRDLDTTIPLDLHGTPFQLSVWKEMLRIPAGKTRSYADVARNIGRPKAFRAVAQACGANPVPIVVPCHRVVASGGRLGGYTGGIEKKIHLLDAEGVAGLSY